MSSRVYFEMATVVLAFIFVGVIHYLAKQLETLTRIETTIASMKDEEPSGWYEGVYEGSSHAILTAMLKLRMRLFVIFSVPFVAAVLAWPLYFTRLWSYIRMQAVSSFSMHLTVVASFVILAIVLFWVRLWFRKLYGYTEIGIGMTMLWVALASQSASELPAMIGVASGVYVVVRGIDNCAQPPFRDLTPWKYKRKR